MTNQTIVSHESRLKSNFTFLFKVNIPYTFISWPVHDQAMLQARPVYSSQCTLSDFFTLPPSLTFPCLWPYCWRSMVCLPDQTAIVWVSEHAKLWRDAIHHSHREQEIHHHVRYLGQDETTPRRMRWALLSFTWARRGVYTGITKYTNWD